MKTCTKCNESKTVDKFYKDSRAKDGLQTWCKECRKAYREIYRTNNPNYAREHYQANKETYNNAGKEWRDRNPEKSREYQKKWRENNRETSRERVRTYAKDHPETVRRRNVKRRARKAGAFVKGAYIPSYDELVGFYGTNCLFPGCLNSDTTYDHVVPYALGGDNRLLNIQPMCLQHNASKGDRHSTDYRTFKWMDRHPLLGDIRYTPYAY